MLEILLGTALIAFGAALSGSFAMPMTRTRGWDWEHGWLAFCLFAYVVFPILLSALFAPGFMDVLASQSTSTLVWIFSLGFLYGLANLSFGLSLKYLGFSLGFSISLGLMMIFGTITPPLLDGRLSELLGSSNGIYLIIGLIVALVGVVISAYSGYIKEQSEGADKQEFNFAKGIGLALFVGVTGSAQALGIEQGNGISQEMAAIGIDPLFQSLPVLIVVFGGSFLSTFIWCIYLSVRRKNVMEFFCGDSNNRPILNNYLFSSIAGLLWFGNFFFYLMGRSRMGEYSFTAWGILMSLTIVCGTLWGIYRGEWRGATKSNKRIMYIGLLVLTIASFIIGMSN